MITPADFAVFVTNVNTMIGNAYSSAEPEAPKFVTPVPITGTIYEDGWTGRMPKPRVWAGPRVVHEPGPQTYTAQPFPYELTAGVDRFRVDDDLHGIYFRVLPDLALQMKLLMDYESRDLIEAAGNYTGARQNGLDALTFFNTAHPIDFYDSSKGTYSNDFSGGGANVSFKAPDGSTKTILTGGALSPVALQTLWEYMTTLKGEDGEVLGVEPTTIMVPSFLKGEAEFIINSTFLAPPAWGSITGQVGAADNPLRRFGLDIIVNKRLKLLNTWYLQDNSKAVKSMRWGIREAPILVPMVTENSPNVFNEHKYVWGYWSRGTALWSYSWLMCRSGP